jgi:hypothetical protein
VHGDEQLLGGTDGLVGEMRVVVAFVGVTVVVVVVVSYETLDAAFEDADPHHGEELLCGVDENEEREGMSVR